MRYSNLVVNADCMDHLPSYKDDHFDLAIVDPPYFSGPETRGYYGSKVSVTKVKRVDYPISENWNVPDKEYFDQLIRISKDQIIWGCNYYDYNFGPGRIIWDKLNGDSSFSDCEIAFTSRHDSVRKYSFMWNGFMQGKSSLHGDIQQGNKKLNEKRIHPTQKPVALYDWLLNTYCEPDFKLLDTHIGSGSIRISAFKYGIDLVGYELDPEHFINQEKRYKQFASQGVINFK